MAARVTVFRTRRHVEVVGVSCPPDGRATLRLGLHPFDEFIEQAGTERMLLNGDQLHLTTPHRLATAPNFTRCSRVRISQCGVTNWNLGTASYAMISNSVNLVTFENSQVNQALSVEVTIAKDVPSRWQATRQLTG